MADLTLPLPPGSTIGIMGGGQLGRMLSQAASRLGFDVLILDPEENCPAARVSRGQFVAAYDDPAALTIMGRACDVVTFEFENVPAASIERLAEGGALVAPGPTALAVAQDRVDEKTFLNAVGAATVDFVAVDTLDDLIAGLETLGAPALLKTRRDGYDGKGQAWVASADEAAEAFAAIGGRPAILEARAAFTRELSIIAARGHDGSIAVYPLGENKHSGGVLRVTTAPALIDAATDARARAIAEDILDGLDYVGITYVPAFLTSAGSFGETQALWLATAAAVVVILVTPFAGIASDRWGRKPVLIGLALASAILPMTMFSLMAGGIESRALLGALVLAAVAGGVSAVGAVATAEQFPGEGRLTGLALGATAATAVFGGFTPWIAELLVKSTGWTMAPGAMIAVVALAVVPVLWWSPETAPGRIRAASPD